MLLSVFAFVGLVKVSPSAVKKPTKPMAFLGCSEYGTKKSESSWYEYILPQGVSVLSFCGPKPTINALKNPTNHKPPNIKPLKNPP